MQSRVIPAHDGVPLHVGVTGSGPDVVVLSGGPGCVQYLEDDEIAPRGFRTWYPEPRGVGRSGGGGHTMTQAVADLEAVRRAAGVDEWIVVGHSWGSDLALFYALQHPDAVRAVVGIAGTGIQKDRTWSEEYHARRDTEPDIPIAWVPEVHAALSASYLEWIHEPRVLRRVADCTVPMRFVAPGADIRPAWPLQQLGELAPLGAFVCIPGVPHDFWATHPAIWVRAVTDACTELARSASRHRSAGKDHPD
ncbi:alpha/beta fold hydrolase [Krasilnikovia sp. MM14-A1259]|uniref:alpha/beta fold hydrolase n=1 Tax=Krasilnikovia sp. MM14-A1259 TaxID=3373539 RepID=UPI0038053837